MDSSPGPSCASSSERTYSAVCAGVGVNEEDEEALSRACLGIDGVVEEVWGASSWRSSNALVRSQNNDPNSDGAITGTARGVASIVFVVVEEEEEVVVVVEREWLYSTGLNHEVAREEGEWGLTFWWRAEREEIARADPGRDRTSGVDGEGWEGEEWDGEE